MNSIDFESLLVIIFVLLDDWDRQQGKTLRGRLSEAKPEMTKGVSDVWVEALKEYDRAIAVAPEYAAAWYNKGEVLLKLERYKEAIDATQEVLKLELDYFLAWTQICQALYHLEQYQAAKAHCEESLNINPDYEPTKELFKEIEANLN